MASKPKVMPLTCLSIQQSEKPLKQGLLNALPNFTSAWEYAVFVQWLQDSALGVSHVAAKQIGCSFAQTLSDNLRTSCFHLQRIRLMIFI